MDMNRAILNACLLLFSLLLFQCGSKKEGRVRLGNEVEPYALDYIEKVNILEPEEQIVAYYDYTIQLNAKEAAIITDKRILHHKKREVTQIPLNEVTNTNMSEEGLPGRTIIEVYSKTGVSLKIEIAPFHGGKTFYRALQNQIGK